MSPDKDDLQLRLRARLQEMKPRVKEGNNGHPVASCLRSVTKRKVNRTFTHPPPSNKRPTSPVKSVQDWAHGHVDRFALVLLRSRLFV
ncbi:hypothetical protein SRHO_G00296460 [Serrasalmus rhombeus]